MKLTMQDFQGYKISQELASDVTAGHKGYKSLHVITHVDTGKVYYEVTSSYAEPLSHDILYGAIRHYNNIIPLDL